MTKKAQWEEELDKKPSSLWYLFAFLLGLVGGIIGFLAIRNHDQIMANKILILGIVVTVAMYVLGVILYA